MIRKTLVLGLGNTICGDDAVGIFAARAFKKENKCSFVDVGETQEAGINLLDLMSGYRKAVLVDSISAQKGRVGTIYRLTRDHLKRGSGLHSSHEIGLATLLDMAQRLEIEMPREIVIYAVAIKNKDAFCERLAPVLRKAIPELVCLIRGEVSGYGH